MKELIIVFVVTLDTVADKYLEPMKLLGFGGDGKEAAVITDGVPQFVDSKFPECVDLILLPDAPLEPNSRDLLKAQSLLKERILVAFHLGTRHKSDRQIKALKEAFGDKFDEAQAKWEHHDRGSVFNALVKLSKNCFSGTTDGYRTALQEFIFLFSGDPVLEAKLDVLHLCTTPVGAGKLASKAGNPYPALTADEWKKVKVTAEQLQKKKPFEKDYMTALAELRIKLLEKERMMATRGEN